MQFDYALFQKAACDKKDRENLRFLIDQLISYCIKARKEGLLSLEDVKDEAPDLFVKQSLGLILTGIDPDIFQDILITTINASQSRGKQLLTLMIEATGLLALESGLNPELARIQMEAFLGD